VKEHNLTREEYAWKYRNEEITICPICEKEYYRSYKEIGLGKHKICGAKECHDKQVSITSTRTNKNRSKESYRQASFNANKTKAKHKEEKERNQFVPSIRINLSPLIECSNCNRRFIDKIGFENHLSQSESCRRKEIYVCRIESCKKSFSSICALNKHYDNEHTVEELVKKLFDGTRPTCKCGCGQVAERSRDDRIFNEYVKGHCTWNQTLSEEKRLLAQENSAKPEARAKAYEKICKTNFERFGVYCCFAPSFSIESQELFQQIEKHLPKDIKCFFATNGTPTYTNEYQVQCEAHTRYLDFYVPTLNKWIEFDEEHHLKESVAIEDYKREIEIKNSIKDIELLRISVADFEQNKEEVLKRCLEFILAN
jgi:hypothetical protein